MPSNPKGYMGEYYKKNKSKFNNPKEKKKRAARNRARYAMEKKLGHEIPSDMEVDHKRMMKHGGGNRMDNLRVIPATLNRSRNGKHPAGLPKVRYKK